MCTCGQLEEFQKSYCSVIHERCGRKEVWEQVLSWSVWYGMVSSLNFFFFRFLSVIVGFFPWFCFYNIIILYVFLIFAIFSLPTRYHLQARNYGSNPFLSKIGWYHLCCLCFKADTYLYLYIRIYLNSLLTFFLYLHSQPTLTFSSTKISWHV